MSDGSGSSDDDGDYALDNQAPESSVRYPVHDCCEFDDAETLRRLILRPVEESDEEEAEENCGSKLLGKSSHHREDDNDDDSLESSAASSSDEGESAAAAHAAALGNSPQPIHQRTPVEESKSSVGPNDDGCANEKMMNGGDADSKKEEQSHTKDSNFDFPASRNIRYYCPYNLNERDPDENTPIHIAILARRLEHVKILLQAGASVHKKSDGSPPIHAAISMGSLPQHADFALECVKVLAENDADLAAKDDALHSPLYLACMYNLPHVVSFLLSTEIGKSTLNTKSDRSQGTALHVAAKFNPATNVFANPTKAKRGTHVFSAAHLHHPDGSVANALHHIPGYPGKQADRQFHPEAISSTEETAIQILLRTDGIEIDAPNSVGQTPLHIACSRGNWNAVRVLLGKGASPDLPDRRGFTPGQISHKRGLVIPNDLLETLGGPPTSGVVPPPRDLIVDPDSNTLLITHELCILHRTCPPVRRDATEEPPPENVRRLQVLVDNETGILRTREFSNCNWQGEARRAALVDVLKCHEYSYVETISQMCSVIPDHPSAVAHLDADTTMSRWTFEAALRAAGSVCEAVDKVMLGDFRNAFCMVRPPGHHAGPRGIVRCANDPDGGSHGFCFLNNVAIGAAYARSMYRNEGIRKIAIVDFDVHHGNGTEEIIRQLAPNVEKTVIRTPFAVGELAAPKYRPWLDETDIQDVFFASAHGYGPRGLDFSDTPSGGFFYPASGKTHTSDAIKNPSIVESPNLTDFLLSQTWTRMGDDARGNCCKILNCGLPLHPREGVPGMQRLEVRDTYRQTILPHLREFDPDIIFISAGFDAHKKDTMNFGYVGMVEDDYEWVTEQLVRIANTCCNGRIVSVLEGGYKIHGGIVSPFARSVASHVRALVDGGKSRELYDLQDGEWESQFERHLIDERERKRQYKLEKVRSIEEQSRRALYGDGEGADGGEEPSTRKRKRNQVDYRQLYEQMKKEGFAA
ncbi:histone deacetylase superfamily protein [Nitzschia inconspicua]|uniref:Histone deacetylase superfamily protein n=1 Tax=Nitzschia inconspicua TaxID=303405 RepID=A0A9K3LTZ1_9STRA|nr:histone deacetylase superfamily protein [Nitzschia inconspicua]